MSVSNTDNSIIVTKSKKKENKASFFKTYQLVTGENLTL